jgi:hypothetical protein
VSSAVSLAHSEPAPAHMPSHRALFSGLTPFHLTRTMIRRLRLCCQARSPVTSADKPTVFALAGFTRVSPQTAQLEGTHKKEIGSIQAFDVSVLPAACTKAGSSVATHHTEPQHYRGRVAAQPVDSSGVKLPLCTTFFLCML